VSKRLLKIVWEDLHGVPWPEGMYACHRCDEPRCASPHHIFPGTQSENIRDAYEKRGAWGSVHGAGESHRFSKLTQADVASIRARFARGEKVGRLAAEYGVHQSSVSKVIAGTRWGGEEVAVVG
jgi:hypothetical protein